MNLRRIVVTLGVALAGLGLGGGMALGQSTVSEREMKKILREQKRIEAREPPRPKPPKAPPPTPEERQRQSDEIVATVRELCEMLKRPSLTSYQVGAFLGTVRRDHPETGEFSLQPHNPRLRRPEDYSGVRTGGRPDQVWMVDLLVTLENPPVTLADLERAFGPAHVAYPYGYDLDVDFGWQRPASGPWHCRISAAVDILHLDLKLFDFDAERLDPRQRRDVLDVTHFNLERERVDEQGNYLPEDAAPRASPPSPLVRSSAP